MFPSFEQLRTLDPTENARRLQSVGFLSPESAVSSLLRICDAWSGRRADPRAVMHAATPSVDSSLSDSPAWYVILQRVLREAPLRDTVLNVIEQFVRNAITQMDVFSLFEQSPRCLDILARLACASPFLTQTLLADPLFLTTLTLHGRTAEMKSREQFVNEAMMATERQLKRPAMLAELRRYQRRQLLRIGMCDAFGLLDLRFVTLQLSLLADSMVQVCLNLAQAEVGGSPGRLAIIALGKHGGEELNYSSDIDLVLIGDRDTRNYSESLV